MDRHTFQLMASGGPRATLSRHHDVPPGVAREDIARAQRRPAESVGGLDVYVHAAAAALYARPDRVVADGAADEVAFATLPHYQTGPPIAPNFAALQPPLSIFFAKYACGITVVNPAAPRAT